MVEIDSKIKKKVDLSNINSIIDSKILSKNINFEKPLVNSTVNVLLHFDKIF
jgi:hypothetical protein